jgi:hypothetical protein
VIDDNEFGKWLVTQRLLSKDDLRRAENAQRGRMGRLDTEIIDLQLMSESATLDALGKFKQTRTVSGSQLEYASPSAVRLLTPRIASRLGVVPFKLEGKTLSVATLSPGDLLVEDEIAQQTGCMVACFVALEIRFVEALNRHYQAPITARYAGLVRRLSGVNEAVKETPRRPSMDEMDAIPLSSPVSDAPRPAVETRRSMASQPADALELSAEERDLFPSLRDEEAELAAEAGAISGEVALVREDQPAAPAPPTQTAPPAEAEIGLEALLDAASHAMQNVEMRDDIADAMLGFCAPIFRRRMMLVQRGSTIMGWRGEGAGVDQQAVRAISIPVDEPSVFSGLLQGVDFWLGPLPTMPHNADLTMALGGPPPKDCYLMPVRVRDRVVCFLYGDNQDVGVGGVPLAELKRLAGKAGLAFQVYLLKGKIRVS